MATPGVADGVGAWRPPPPSFRRQGHVVGVAAHAKADYRRIFCAARPWPISYSSSSAPRPRPIAKAVPVLSQGRRRRLSGRHCAWTGPGCSKSTQAHRGGAISAPPTNIIGVTQGNEPAPGRCCVCPGGAGGDDGEIGALHIVHHRQVAEIMLMMEPGTKNGDILRGPRSL